MTDKVRAVRFQLVPDSSLLAGCVRLELIDDSSNPTHLLVPVDGCEKWKAPDEEEGFLVAKIPIKDCPTCGGSGDVSDGTLQTWVTIGDVPCPDCINGCVIGGDDE